VNIWCVFFVKISMWIRSVYQLSSSMSIWRFNFSDAVRKVSKTITRWSTPVTVVHKAVTYSTSSSEEFSYCSCDRRSAWDFSEILRLIKSCILRVWGWWCWESVILDLRVMGSYCACYSFSQENMRRALVHRSSSEVSNISRKISAASWFGS
jgi:hypothetical protein